MRELALGASPTRARIVMTTPFWLSTTKRGADEDATSPPTKKLKTMESLEGDAGFMDKYSRQIGAFGLETMAKVHEHAS